MLYKILETVLFAVVVVLSWNLGSRWGHNNGYEKGENTGYDNGFRDGYSEGYNEGCYDTLPTFDYYN